MKSPIEVLKEHKQIALYWTQAIQRRHEMQLPRPHDSLEVRSLLYGGIIRDLYFALKQSLAENETLIERSNKAMTRAVQAEADLEEYKEGIEVERQWKQEAYDRNTQLINENMEVKMLLGYLRTKNMFGGPALRTDTYQVAPISDRLAKRIDDLLEEKA